MGGNNTKLDFLEDFTPLSTTLVDFSIQPPIAYVNLRTGSFIIINSVLCFKRFETRFLNGIGDANNVSCLG